MKTHVHPWKSMYIKELIRYLDHALTHILCEEQEEEEVKEEKVEEVEVFLCLTYLSYEDRS